MYRIPEGVTAICFDIWKTLLNGNRNFTRARLRLIFDSLGLDRVPTEQLYQAYRHADQFYNDLAEEAMEDYGMSERLVMMFDIIGIVQEPPYASVIYDLQQRVGEMRTQPEYMPSLIEADLPQTLQALLDRGFKLGVLSNTGMDNELVMRPVLTRLGIWDLFQVRIFSSEDGRAKPNPHLFRDTALKLAACPDQVLHVGDNPNADYRAHEAGLHAVLYAPDGSALPHITTMKQLLV